MSPAGRPGKLHLTLTAQLRTPFPGPFSENRSRKSSVVALHPQDDPVPKYN